MSSSAVEKRTVRVGMLGAGFILKSHASAVATLPGVKLHMVADASATRARQAAADYGFEHSVESLESIASSDCDVVHVLLPPFLHEEAAETLIRADKSVFLEKPMGLDSHACSRLCDLAEERGVVLGVNHNFLFVPQYEALRSLVKTGKLGQLDQLAANWHASLPQLQSGPFDNWMLGTCSNLFFELSPHLIAFVLDLVGEVEVRAAVVGDPVTLPSNIEMFRHWSVIAEKGATNIVISLSVAPGQADRLLRVRGSGGSAQVDFGRDIGWQEKTDSDNPLFEAHGIASSIVGQVKRQAKIDRRRRILSAIRQRPDANPFEESILRSIQAFYAGGLRELDPRQDGRFGTAVIRLCERIVEVAGTGGPTQAGVRVEVPSPAAPPRILVVGGTGFIGRTLVRKLVQRGLAVRVLTRSLNAAAIEFQGLPLELMQGSHGNREQAAAAVKGIETVYHLAKSDGKNWQDYVVGDVEPTRILAEAALKAGVKRFIYTGTIDSYASANPRSRIDCSTSLDPRIGGRNLYARSKAANEALLSELHRTRGLPLVIFRPGIVIGRGSPPQHVGVARFLNETEAEYWGDGRNKLPFVLVDDVADALVRGHDAPDIDGESFLLTSEPLLSAEEYIKEVSNHTGVPVTTRKRPAWRHWAADFVKETVKNAIRHPNRRRSTLHDWSCRAHCAGYDSAYTRSRLGWSPASSREDLLNAVFLKEA